MLSILEKVLLAGGSYGGNVKESEAFDISDQLNEKQSLGLADSLYNLEIFGAVLAIDDHSQIIACGGKDDSGEVLDTCQLLWRDNDTDSKFRTMLHPRKHASGIVIEDFLFMTGGYYQ